MTKNSDTRKILLTGVSRGLGQALCDAFVADGHSVAGCARSATAIDELNQRYGAPNHFAAVDLSDDTAVAAWIETVTKEWGTPDLVINNAAIINDNAPLWEVPLHDFKQLVDVNITGVFSVIRHVLPAMINQGSGVIANLSSGWGRSVSADVASYCASKWAIEGMTLALAEDLPNGLAAVSVNPGIINTEMLQSCFGASASNAPVASEWAKSAAPFFLGLDQRDNGKQKSV